MNDATRDADSAVAGVNQSRVRDHNERLVMTIIQRNGNLPGSEIARRSGLSPQTVSVILRGLESDGLLRKGEPRRGKVGKPSVPLSLNPDGILSVGLKIGRRSSEISLMDVLGNVRHAAQINYRLPDPTTVFDFLRATLEDIHALLTPAQAQRLVGIGIAAPFEMWKWENHLGARQNELLVWENLSFADCVARFSELPVFVENDATAACRAEQVFGLGSRLGDFGYFYIGAFIGGGIVLNRSVFDGGQGNAGAFGSLPVQAPDGTRAQLIETASINTLASRIEAEGADPARLSRRPLDWRGIDAALETWIDEAGRSLAQAIVSVLSVIDFKDFVIDGGIPDDVRRRIVESVRDHLEGEDLRGLTLPEIHEGTIGPDARSIGAAAVPVYARYLLNSHAGWS